ncbi:MAG TPA: substrate-binding domain-containing protein [Kofleriaceae bacterium]|jgi:phosphate transport system substrate-binding protein|nr:substrate-binding domain-containing protein [Kofleriaceae bacterium]
MRAAVALALVACSAPTAPVVAPKPALPPLERARAFELPPHRDYARAAEIYADACRDGQADQLACRKLIAAILHGRGTEFDDQRLARIADAMCRNHDLYGCIALSYALDAPRDAPLRTEAERARIDPGPACERGDAAACEVVLELQGPNVSGGATVNAEHRREAISACKAGVLRGCAQLIADVTACPPNNVARCSLALELAWKADDEHAELDALAHVRAECDRGDADACALLPGREVAPAKLCAAHDYTACAAAACGGDATADAIAKAHRADANCAVIAERDARRRQPPPSTREPMPAEPPIKSAAPQVLPPFHAIAFRRLATAMDDWSWPRFEIRNQSVVKIVRLRAFLYAYDASGAQVARSRPIETGPILLAPGAVATIAADPTDRIPDAAVAFGLCYDQIAIDGFTFAGVGGTTDAVGCPAQLPRGSSGLIFDAGGSLTQRRVHAAARDHAVARYETTEGTPAGASIDGLGALVNGAFVFAGSDVRGPAGTTTVPIAVAGIGVIYNLGSTPALRLTPEALAKILQGDITRWNDRELARDNPLVTLPEEPIVVMREVGWNPSTDRDPDMSRTLVAYLVHAAKRVWHFGAGFTWPIEIRRVQGLVSLVGMTEGTIAFVELSEAHAQGDAQFASIRNAAGTFVAPDAASLAAAAVDLGDAAPAGIIDAKRRDAYPLAFPTFVVLPQHADPHVLDYVRYLLGDGQALLESAGFARLPARVIAKARVQL